MEADPIAPVDDFTRQALGFWQERGGRMTVVREIICKAIATRDSAFVTEDLWKEVRKHDPGISMASVYRTVADLLEAKLLQEIRGPREHRSFVKSGSAEAATGHLICKDCRRILPLDAGCLALREGAVIRGLGFQTAGMHLQIEAGCDALKRCGTCENLPDSVH
jgi:Fur family transcriptional regulator, ferric uptake regulator